MGLLLLFGPLSCNTKCPRQMFTAARINWVIRDSPSKTPSHLLNLKGRGNLCRGGPGLRDLVFNDRLAVAILTAIAWAQKFPAVGYVISNRFLDLFDMRAADNLVIEKLSHSRAGYQAPVYTAILKCRLVRLDASSVAIQSHNGFKSSSSSANFRNALSSSMARRSRLLASPIRSWHRLAGTSVAELRRRDRLSRQALAPV
jgi:hypothetical protein